ncbi:MAG: hypothetical protein HN849_17595 [Victivallales bacterium]|jgi:hypothetical protein|nr:hypothetical protein [Victivallales bacterium]
MGSHHTRGSPGVTLRHVPARWLLTAPVATSPLLGAQKKRDEAQQEHAEAARGMLQHWQTEYKRRRNLWRDLRAYGFHV